MAEIRRHVVDAFCNWAEAVHLSKSKSPPARPMEDLTEPELRAVAAEMDRRSWRRRAQEESLRELKRLLGDTPSKPRPPK